ncbi:MAG: SAM-dependent methyltransferase [Solirubrobacteraceae bacterium]
MSGAAREVDGAQRFDAERFERIYEDSRDPWGYLSSAYERDKYADTLAALPAKPIGRALEVGCSIGVFTEQLAPHVGQLVALDFSARALELARPRLSALANVTLVRGSFPEQAPAGPWDLVVCSEILYYLDRETLTAATAWLAARLCEGASVLAVSWRGHGVHEPLHGDEAHDALARELQRWHSFDGRASGQERFDGRARGRARFDGRAPGQARRDGYRIDRFDG